MKYRRPNPITNEGASPHVANPRRPLSSRPRRHGAHPGYATTKETLAAGTGPIVAKGDTVTVHATGTVEQTMKKFWSTKDPGQQPFTYQAGVGKVITGWDQGCLGMNVGETRNLRIPADEGYGQGGFPAWGIPPGGTLLFEIEVLSIKGKGGEL
jgi:FKBP-type peptidyl-prolyl cis-trans isomerase